MLFLTTRKQHFDMKKTILSLLFSMAATVAVFAQDVNVTPNPAYANGTNEDIEVVAYSEVVNNTSETITLTWTRTVENLDNDGWATLVCDKNSCWAPFTSTKDFELAPGEAGTMDVHFQNMFSVGSGYVEIEIKNTATGEVYAVGEYSADAVVGIEEAVVNTINIYPNPARDILNMELSEGIARVELFNLLGQRIQFLDVNNGDDLKSINTTDLTEGMYFVNFYGHNNEAIDSRVFSKID